MIDSLSRVCWAAERFASEDMVVGAASSAKAGPYSLLTQQPFQLSRVRFLCLSLRPAWADEYRYAIHVRIAPDLTGS